MRVNVKTLYTRKGQRETLYLLGQRGENVSAGGFWGFGGCALDGEGTEQAAHRLSRERFGLTDHELRPVHEWVQSGISTPEPGLRSLWTAETTATAEDLTLQGSVLQSAAFFPVEQIARKKMTDTTRVALHLAIPGLTRKLDHGARIRGVLFDLAGTDSDQSRLVRPEVVTELGVLGYRTAVIAEPQLTGLDTGAEQSVDPTLLRVGRPDPDRFRVAAKQLGLSAAECLVVGVDQLDLIAASAADAATVRFDDPEDQARSVQNAGIHAVGEPWPVVTDLSEIPSLLDWAA